MGPQLDNIRDFVHQIERSLAARRLYNPSSVPYREANERLLERCRAALGEDGFTIRVGATDLFLDKVSLINRPKRDDSFFFPLYRDGLRELTFSIDTSAQDLDALMGAFEANERMLGAADDLVNYLWRCDMTTIAHSAIDGIGDVEDDGSEDGKDDFRGLVADLSAKIQKPAAPEGGQRYAFMLDNDVNVAAQDFHYDATTTRRTFEESPNVLRLSREQAAELRRELDEGRDDVLLERFIEILFTIMRSPLQTANPATIAPIFQQLVEGYWHARDFRKLIVLLVYMRSTATEAPDPAKRAAMAEVFNSSLNDERLQAIVGELESGALQIAVVSRLFDLVADERMWPFLLDALSRLPEGEQRTAFVGMLRKRLATNPALMTQTLASSEPLRVRAGLSLLDERTERLFAKDLIGLAAHPDEAIRLKGLSAAARLGGESSIPTLWKAMESDPSKSVRLFAFRAMASSRDPSIAPRLQALIASPQFAARPVWEREKYVRLLGNVAGAAAEPLFESWIPAKKWISLWQPKELETLELALRGLGACGPSGYEKVRKLAESAGGKQGELARKVLDSISRCEVGENTVMRPRPTMTGTTPVPDLSTRPTLTNVPLPQSGEKKGR